MKYMYSFQNYLLASGVIADVDCKLDRHFKGAFKDFFLGFCFFPPVSI